MDIEPTTIFSFDPGKTTGWAEWNICTNDFQMPNRFGEEKLNTIFSFLDSIDTGSNIRTLFVYENYRINNLKFNHQWDDGTTLRVIGAIEYRAHQLIIPFKKQEPSIRSVGAGYSGLPHDPKKHTKDHISAMQHGYYYMVKNKLMLPRG